ncbi:MAG TPA: hypothetical protein ENK32_01460 [Anaerolineae bacterium]|nr:hypothetical protein [Anaerolineae bacterium]
MQTLAFHGGTSLRFLYNMPRYSEDLDFALELHPETPVKKHEPKYIANSCTSKWITIPNLFTR